MADKADICILVSAGAEWRALLPHYPKVEIESSPYGECFFTQVGNQRAWFLHARFPDPTLADAILDRLVHNAHRVELQGESQRKLRAPRTMSAT